jgi:6-phosphofructokinase
MDLREPVLALLVGGSPAPGINGVISAVVLEGFNNKCRVVGIFQGFERLRSGESECIHVFSIDDVASLHRQGGSFLKTSKLQLESEIHVDNALRALTHLRVRYLVTIGGVDTMQSAAALATAAKEAEIALSVCHVPKTIFNDLPMPNEIQTFGFNTARETGTRIVVNLMEDAKALFRFVSKCCLKFHP